jgi:hypothetical protein
MSATSGEQHYCILAGEWATAAAHIVWGRRMSEARYSWVKDRVNGPKKDFVSRAGAIRRLLRANCGEVWTIDGCHLVAWLDGDYLKMVDLRTSQTRTVRKTALK